MPFITLVLSLLSLLPMQARIAMQAAGVQPAGYEALRSRAEASYAEKSFGRAHELYEEASKLTLSSDEKRWVEFRLADTSWRAAAANPSADPTVRDAARAALEELVRKAGDDHDRIWAEANESLGDYHWIQPSLRNQGEAQRYYAAALDWWGGSDDLETARARYLAIVFRFSQAPEWWGSGIASVYQIPREWLVDAVAIAKSPRDRSFSRYLLATKLLQEGNPESVERAVEHLEAVVREGKSSDWYDDALQALATRYNQGVVVVRDGRTAYEPDFARALELYRRIVAEFKPTETRYYEEAKRAIEQITGPQVAVNLLTNFLPDSEQQIAISWRNVSAVEMTITAVDLTKDVDFGPEPKPLVSAIKTAGRTVVRRWTHTTQPGATYAPGYQTFPMKPRLEPGAYVVAARAGGKSSEQLLLVSDMTIVTHALAGATHVYVADVLTGAPIAGATVRVWQQKYDAKIASRLVQTDTSGLAKIEGIESASGTTWVTAAKGSRQAWHSTYSYNYYNRDERPEWRIYAFTDRPAYRPGETVQWKIIARVRDGEQWATPEGKALEYEIYDPRSEKVASGKLTLNSFGSAWSELPLTSSMALGEFRIGFKDPERQHEEIGGAMLFRLEEYKLPEFKVSVSTPEEDGKRKLYRLGDTIEATIDASYYFGGPVANATVEAVIHQRPFVRYWYPWRQEYSWYWDDDSRSYDYGDSILRTETLKTDANGRAIVRIETPRDGNDTSYRIEARVVDASRREVRGEGTVRVMRRRYSVFATPEHYLHRPGERVTVDFKASDANDQPVETAGTVRVVRRKWSEEERFTGYRDEQILETEVRTDAEGKAAFTFTPERTGYYIVSWTSEDVDPKAPARARDLVTAETTVWVTESKTTDLGYHASGLEIILDKETMRAGSPSPVLIVTPSSGRWVVLTTSGDSLLDTQVLHLDGTAKVVMLPIDDRHVPNFFVSASSVFDRVFSADTKRAVVPPVEHFIDVGVKLDRAQYEPREEGKITVTTRGVDGKPVAAEVALAVTDESVTAIQQDMAGDPRPFFFGDLRTQMPQLSASVQSQRYARLIERDGKLIDEEEQKRRDAAGKKDGDRGYYDALQAKQEGGVEGGVVGGVIGGDVNYITRSALPASVPPPPPAPVGVAEAITVSAEAPMLQKSAAVANAARDEADQSVAVQVRSDFRSTAFWKPDVVTGADGTATVTVKFPEALTTWRATARAVAKGSRFGMGDGSAATNQPLMVRLQAPRFFVAGDRTTISAILNNNTGEAMRVTPSLEVEGLTLRDGAKSAVDVPAHGEQRVDWTVLAEKPGNAKLRVTGRAASRGDSMEKTFTVYEHGIDKLVARSGKLRADEALVKLELPDARRETAMSVQIAPSLAVTMLDALPYLIDYPYGCTEQTMSRFLPAAIVARTLAKNGLEPRDIEGRVFGGIEPTTPQKAKNNLGKLDAITTASMNRLYDMQHADGGWGWWKDGTSDDFMTGYVIWGFAVAKEGGLPVKDAAIERAVQWLDTQLPKNEGQGHDEAWLLHAVAAWRKAAKSGAQTPSEKKAFDDAWKNRERLTAYSRALLALAAHDFGDAERAQVLIRNLEDGVKIDRTPDQSVLVKSTAGASAAETMATAHWGEDRFWWRWYEGPVETTAFALQALMAVDPQHRLVEPVMNWLVKNRRGAQWSNTRDTAISLLALNDYLQASGELQGDVAYELSVNGRVLATKTIKPSEVLRAPSRFAVDAELVRSGANEIRIRRTRGTSPLYFAAEARFVSLEEPVKAAGNELFVRRDYYRLAPKATLLKGVVYEKQPLDDGGKVVSGDRVEVVLTIETKNDYDYLLFEDLKPAGLEAVALQSGEPLYASEIRATSVLRKTAPGVRRAPEADRTGRSAWVYQELRDRKVALFIDHLPQGTWEIRYTLRAEVPGAFHALPLLGHAMYVPEIRANGDEVRIEVTE